MPNADEMRNLGESILTAQRDRAGAIAGLKADTFAYMGEVAEFTAARKVDVASQLAEIDAAHQAMARETQERLAQDTAAMKTDTAAFVGELAAGTAARKADVASQLAEIDAAHQAMAKELHARLEGDNAALMAELQNLDEARNAEVDAMLSEYDAAHQAMARETRERLAQEKATMKADTSAFVAEVAQTTKERKAEVASQVAGYATEMSQARDAWREHLGAPPPRPRKVRKVKAAPPPKAKAAPPPPRVEAAPPSPPPVKEATPDDLALIRGIGASMEARLNGMGITTYAQLAEASPDMIREELGDFGRLAEVEEWIARAEELI